MPEQPEAAGNTTPVTRPAEEDKVIWRTSEPKPAEAPVRKPVPRTVAAGFAEFCERLVPKYTESEEAAATLQAIEKRLAGTFNVTFMAPYGSRGHGTNVRGLSAIDSFVVMPTADLYEDSEKSLKFFRDCLAPVLPGTHITEGRPVVAVPFGTRPSEQHHVVPAFLNGTREGHDMFSIPAPRGRWVDICPAAHSIWINELDTTLNKNLKKFIRVVKAWSHYNDGIVWRYYLELCAADYLKKDSAIVYSRDLHNFFRYLADRKLAPFENTQGCAEPVYGTSRAHRDTAIAFIQSTLAMAEKALECEQRGNTADAFYWWRKIFDWRFAAF